MELTHGTGQDTPIVSVQAGKAPEEESDGVSDSADDEGVSESTE